MIVISGGFRARFPDELRIWNGIKTRCLNPKSSDYRLYGGRGITICERWRKSFEAFLQDVGQRPSKGHTIDRIDNNGNYEPENVRWATKSEQQWNTRQTHMLALNGVAKPLSVWAREIGISASALRGRLSSIPECDALSLAPATAGKKLLGNGWRNMRRESRSATGLKGVYRNGKRFEARIKVAGRVEYLGLFSLPEDAADAYDRAAVAFFGPNARTNGIAATF